MASRLGLDQSVMGNLASSNLVSASFFFFLFLASFVAENATLGQTTCSQKVHNTADQKNHNFSCHKCEMYCARL